MGTKQIFISKISQTAFITQQQQQQKQTIEKKVSLIDTYQR